MYDAGMKVLALLAAATLATGCAHQAPANPEKELLQLHEEWAAARVQGNVAFLERFYGEELRLNQADGGVVQRNEDIELFNRAGKSDQDVVKPEYIRDVDMKVASYGSTAVVTGVENLKGTYKGRSGEMALRFTNVMVWRDGRWQLVSHQSTRVQSK
jgi:ketosteroid isomerase-like protein